MPDSQPDFEPSIQDFIHFVKTNSCTGLRGFASNSHSPFLPFPQLKQYLSNTSQIARILKAVLQTKEHTVDHALVSHKYARVFSILLLIGKGRYIDHFVRYDSLDDEKLPFPKQCPEHFPVETIDPHFFNRFYEEQWRFCAPIFRRKMNSDFESRRVLPIIYMEKIASGGSAVLHKIILHEDYNDFYSSDINPLDRTYPHANTFALKSFCTLQNFDMELEGFRRLSPSLDPGLVSFFGSFRQDNKYHILLEYADLGNLEQYFHDTDPPKTFDEILSFWRSHREVLSALHHIHDVNDNEPPGPGMFQGWHQDVKPKNILVKSSESKSRHQVQFVLADLGLSHFRQNVAGEEPRDTNTCGTRTYGAPESSRPYARVTRRIDVWSLGCVFSEAAVWSVLGFTGLNKYREARKLEVSKSASSEDGDCFHDGEKALKAVSEMHEEIVKCIQPFDTLTKDILKMISEHMLHESPQIRLDASQLLAKFETVLSSAVNDAARFIHRKAFRLPLQRPPETPTPILAFSNQSLYNSQDPNRSFQTRNDHQGLPSVEKMPAAGLSSQDRWHRSVTGYDAEADDQRPNISSPATDFPQRYRETIDVPYVMEPKNVVDKEKDMIDGEDSDMIRNERNPAYFDEGAPALVSRRNSESNLYEKHQRIDRGHHRGIRNSGGLPPKTKERILMQNSLSNLGQNFAESQHSLRNSNGSPEVPRNLRITEKDQEALPRWTVAEAQRWKQNRKNKKSKSPLPFEKKLREFDKRDHLFIVDDSESMERYWADVEDVFDLLAYIVKRADPGGVELCFTSSSENFKSKRTKKLLRQLDHKGRNLRGSDSTNIGSCLGRVFQDYKDRLDRQLQSTCLWSVLRSRVRPKSIYILTDGCWQPRDGVDSLIGDLVSVLKRCGKNRAQVGIQFIQFGADIKATERLEYLDSGLRFGDWDIVDREPHDGNVLKMLLGANNKWFDQDPEYSQDAHARPSSETGESSSSSSKKKYGV